MNHKEIWIKNSNDILGWKTIIGPDILYKNGDDLKCVFLHTNIVQEYKINVSQLLLNGKLETGQTITLNKEGLLKLAKENYEFSYFKAGDVLKDSIVQVKDARFVGKWYIDDRRQSYFILKDIVDENTHDNLMQFNVNDSEMQGKWSLFSTDKYMLLELNTGNGIRKTVIVDSINSSSVDCHYFDLTGKRTDLKFQK